MRRIGILILVLCAAALVFVLGTGAGHGGTYKVRAIFDDAVSVIPGEEVRAAGVNIGTISSLDVTADRKAAVVLDISNAGFKDFRADAHCTIRPQSLIGEKFVDCTPTQPKPVGAKQAPPLRKIPDGQPGAGQYLLPVQRTSTPVDIDLIGDINRLPYRQRLTLIVAELGTGLAGNADQLRQVIRRADPALQNLDNVLAILARENRTLADLATNSDQILGPLGRDRQQVADFVDKASQVAQATAERRTDLERNLQKLPAFLTEIRPTSQALGQVADQATPVLASLHSNASSINRVIEQLGPFSKAATPAFQSLGRAAEIGGPALKQTLPLARDLRDFAKVAKPLGANLAALTTSLQNTGGLERALDYVFFQVAAINGFDSFGHYLRAGLLADNPLCSAYATTPTGGCSANFGNGAGKTAQASEARNQTISLGQYDGDSILQNTVRVLMGESPSSVLRKHGGKKEKAAARSLLDRTPLTGASDQGSSGSGSSGSGSSGSGAGSGATPPTTTQSSPPPTTTQPANPISGLLNYLLGGGK
jgi:phospholipid/cholesterol/gamma-HCH transport system substrate-binding protein